MFEWKVEEMKLMNGGFGYIDNNKIYNVENKLSQKDKIEFVDSMTDNKLSYIIDKINKFDIDSKDMPKNKRGYVKTVSLIAWLKRNDERKVFDCFYEYGKFNIFGAYGDIETSYKVHVGYNTHENIIDESFHRQLVKCESIEKNYFEEHEEYLILVKEVEFMVGHYNTLFGLQYITGSCGLMYGDFDSNRKFTIDELKILKSKFDKLQLYIKELSYDISLSF